MSGPPVSVYVHVPFCPTKCAYCDFNSYAMSGELVDRTVEAMKAEIARGPHRGRPAKTVFFGGGTPTFLTAAQLTGLLRAVVEAHPLVEGAEVTSEANPGTVDSAKFEAMVQAGFNRVSLGAQSFDAGDLVRLGRVHTPGDVPTAVARARAAGFRRLNLDLMFGLPGQGVRAWRRNLELALSLAPDHLSLYGLTIEPNTRFFRYAQRGLLDLPDDGRQLEMYDEAVRLCASHGLGQYEISNFARPGEECRHNLAYWRCEEYAGYGPGAVGCLGPRGARVRTTNLKGPRSYAEAVEQGRDHVCEREDVDETTQQTEDVMMGMRLNEGLAVATVNKKRMPRMVTAGHLVELGDRVALTQKGRHVANLVIAELLPD